MRMLLSPSHRGQREVGSDPPHGTARACSPTSVWPQVALSLCRQVLYRWSRQSSASVIETNKTSVELSLPFDEDYIIEIKPVSEGGDGSSSEQIRIPKLSSKTLLPDLPACGVRPAHARMGLLAKTEQWAPSRSHSHCQISCQSQYRSSSTVPCQFSTWHSATPGPVWGVAGMLHQSGGTSRRAWQAWVLCSRKWVICCLYWELC